MVNIICAGITGCKKEQAVGSVISCLTKVKPQYSGHVQQVNVEGILEQRQGIKWGTFLKSLNFTAQEKYSREILDQAISQLNEYRHRFLNLHLTLYHDARFFAPFPFDRIRDFKPDLIITFIEDVYDAWARVKKKSDEMLDPEKTYFRLCELLAWRSVETMQADFLASALGIPNFVVAVKHPPQMLYSLIFEPERLIVYAAHPISRFRRKHPTKDLTTLNSEKAALLGFIQKLQEKYIVFSPTTMDERIIQGLKGPLDASSRWEIPHPQMVTEGDLKYPIELVEQEITEVSDDIGPNIRFRDFRLIRDVDCVVAYRPYWDKEMHEGVKSEIDQADNLMIETVLYFPEEDGKVDASPFAGRASGYGRTEEEVLADLEKRKPRKKRIWAI
jgi:adenylate kinase